MKTVVTYRGRITPTDDEVLDLGAFERLFDSLMRELIKLEATDPDVWGSRSSGEIEIAVTTSGDDTPECLRAADTLVRCALHAAGISTKEWGEPEENLHHFELDSRELVTA